MIYHLILDKCVRKTIPERIECQEEELSAFRKEAMAYPSESQECRNIYQCAFVAAKQICILEITIELAH